MSWVAIGVGVAGAATSIITGASQKSKAKKELKKLGNVPQEQIPSAMLENQTLARIRSTTGLPSEQYNTAMQNIQRQQMASLRQAQNRRMGGEVVPTIQDTTNNAMLNLDAANAKQRLANEQQLMRVNQQVGQAQRDIFNRDVRAKYMRDYQYAMSLLGAGNQNISSGINQGVAAAGGALAYGIGSGAFNNVGKEIGGLLNSMKNKTSSNISDRDYQISPNRSRSQSFNDNNANV